MLEALKVRRHDKFRREESMVSILEQMQVPNGTGPGFRRNKHPLLASRTRCKCPMETSRNKVITSKHGNKIKFGNVITIY